MKKLLLLIALSCVGLIQSAIAQSELWSLSANGGANNEGAIFKMNLSGSGYTRLYDFATTTLNASSPQYSTPVQADNGKLYSMTSNGGLNKSGNIFSYDTVTSVFTTVYSFTGGTDGGFPYGSLIKASNGILYGMTTAGGTTSDGVIFSFNVSTGIYTKLFDFNGSSNGGIPYGNLMQASNGFLYGLTYSGGATNDGVLFRYDISTGTFLKLVDFNGTNGRGPRASLIQALNGKLYGTTLGGGTDGVGTIFSYDIGTNTLTKRFDFGNTTTGRYSYSTLVQASTGIFYGTTTVGGANAVGVIYSFDDAVPTYTVIHNFHSTSGTNGSKSYSSLLLASDGKLYGLTAEGGGNSGTIFSCTTGGIFSKLYSLNFISDGANPLGSLMQTSTGKMYGMATDGGTGGYGTFFSFNSNTSSFVNLQNFRVMPLGSAPEASLFKASNGLLYGMTSAGGNFTSGGIFFSFNPQTNVITKLNEFSNGFPSGSVIQATNGKLYGLTHGGGTSGQGSLFSYDISTSTFTTVFSFTGSATGRIPQGSLIQATNGKLYGMTGYGGIAGDNGTIFSYDISTSTFTKHVDFDGTTNGKRPYGNLVQASNGKMYGMTFLGGAADNGVLFSFNPVSNIYSKILEFSPAANGMQPLGSLIQANDGKLYGLTSQGGNNSGGVIFSLDTASNTFTKVYNFTSPVSNTQGCNPYGTLYNASNGKLYGMTFSGGVYGSGVIFSYDVSTSSYSKIRDLNYPDGTNPLYNSFIEIDNIITNTVALNLCANSGVNIPYSIYGTFNAGNVFTAQLSDSSGSFASPVNIGSLSSTTAGSISANIPNLTIAGTSYRIRIISSNPIITGNDNGSNIKISSFAPVTINISANPGNTICNGASVIFTATSTNGGDTPFYVWKKNSVTVLTGTSSYSTASLSNNDTITCTVTSNATCITGNSTVTSNQIIMSVSPLVTPLVSISSSHSGTVCSAISVTYTAVPINGGAPTYQWKKNGINVGTGGAVYTTSGLINGDVISCVMTSTISCITVDTATSNSISLPVGSCTLTTAAVPTNICSNTNFNVSFTTSPTLYNAGNVFTAQLSNASGSFASPVTIGTLTSPTVAPIPVLIPVGTIAGTGYRIRVIASNPSTIGTDNGTNIAISKFNSVFFTESMGTVGATTTVATHETANGFDNDGFTMTGTGDIRITTPSTGYAGASGGANVFLNATIGLNFQIANINTSALINPQLSFGIYKFTNNADASNLLVEVSSNGSTYTPLTFTLLPIGAGTSLWYYRTASGTIPTTTNLRIRITNNTGTQFRFDDIRLTGENPTAGITASGSTFLCNGDSVTLSASSAASYLWSNSATTSSVVIGSLGNNYCDLTAVNSCVLRSNTITTTNGTPIKFNVTGGGNYCSSPGTGVAIGLDSSQLNVTYKLLKLPSTFVGATLNGTGNPISFGDITGAGTYKVIATRTIGACSDTMNGSAVITISTAINYYLDNDGDGYGNDDFDLFTCTPPPNYVLLIPDCNDSDPNINPSITEICCNAIDEDCDALVDEGCTLTAGVYCIGPDPFYAPPSGTYLNANNPFATLTAAVAALNSLGACGDVVFEFQNNYSSVGESAINITYQGTASATATFRPRSDVSGQLLIERNSNILSGDVAMINFNGGDYITFDGSPGGTLGTTPSIIVRNSSDGADAAPVFNFINDATHNTINAISIQARLGGGVRIDTTNGVTGNDFLTIKNCDVRNRSNASSNIYSCIYSRSPVGTNPLTNDVVIQNNNFFNWDLEAISIGNKNAGGNWTIDGNSFYATKSGTAGGSTAIGFNSSDVASNLLITNNYFGGDAPQATGNAFTLVTTTIISASNSGVSTISNNKLSKLIFNWSGSRSFTAIRSVGGPSIVDNNIIGDAAIANDIVFSATSDANFTGIVNGSSQNSVAVSTSGNSINNVSLTNTNGTGTFIGISYSNLSLTTATATIANNILKNINYSQKNTFKGFDITGPGSSSANALINNNKIESITISNTAAKAFNGIRLQAGRATLSGNRIGSDTAPNNISIAGYGIHCAFTATKSGTGTISFLNDTISNITSTLAADSVQLFGISMSGNGASNNTYSFNLIKNLSTASTKPATELSLPNDFALAGILNTYTTGGSINGNTIIGLRATSTTYAHPVVAAICNSFSGTSAYQNTINNLTNIATDTVTHPVIIGLHSSGSALNTAIHYNNMISLNNDGNTNRVKLFGMYDNGSNLTAFCFYNSIAIGGSSIGSSVSSAYFFNNSNLISTRVRDNIFYNSRSSGTGKNYAIANVQANTTYWTSTVSNYNNLYAVNANTVGLWGATEKTLATWKSTTGGDANSQSSNVEFVNANNDLHLTPNNCLLNNAGTTNLGGVSISTDFDGQSRSVTPDIGADEFISSNPELTISLFIEGYYAGGSLTPALVNSGLSADASICDSITVELHQDIAPFSLIYSQTALLKTDGTIACELPCSYSMNNYFLVVKGRNFVETWSKLPVTISTSTVYSFAD